MNTLIKCSNLSRVFDDGAHEHHALRAFTAEFFAGELVAISGPSGAGKSTLFHILGTLDTGYRGSATLYNKELNTLNDTQRAALRQTSVSLGFQTPHLLAHLSVRQNLTLTQNIVGSESRLSERAVALIERFQLQRLLDAPPATLSGGEKRRISLIRTLLKPADVFLLDEPSAHLDEGLQQELFAVLRERKEQGALIIFSSHASQDLRQADRHCSLEVKPS